MQSTEDDPSNLCSVWEGRPEHYQEQASLVAIENGMTFWPWSWIHASCGTFHCINPLHIVVLSATSLAYPYKICIYCGRTAGTRDHLIPRQISGEGHRRNVLTVPACGECNALIGAKPLFSITERREAAQAGLRRKHKKVLRRVNFTKQELSEFGPGLRPAIEAGLREKEELERRLRWPTDPSFDLRALERSGIDDPYVLGLLKHDLQPYTSTTDKENAA